jgi:hypothetical protein
MSSMLMELALTAIKTSFLMGGLGEGIWPNDIVAGTVPSAHHSRMCAACMVPGIGLIITEATKNELTCLSGIFLYPLLNIH